jgi:hypothetical protein
VLDPALLERRTGLANIALDHGNNRFFNVAN